MRRQIYNIAVTWFCLGLIAGVIGASATSCQPASNATVQGVQR